MRTQHLEGEIKNYKERIEVLNDQKLRLDAMVQEYQLEKHKKVRK